MTAVPRWGPAGSLLAGAVVFAVLRGALGVTFNATPLLLGLVVGLAAVCKGREGPWGAALVLVCWGAAVLAVREGPLPDNREAPAFLAAAGLGLLLTSLLVPPPHRAGAVTGGALTVLYGGLAFYFAYDTGQFLDWPVWAAVLAAWGLLEARRAVSLIPQ